MEDYEKKYKEALSRAKSFELPEYKNIVESIFPELGESEDEKIRKRVLFSLQKDFMATKNSGCDTQDLEQCIAWLEKQGDQKPVIDFKAKNWYVSKVDGKIHDMTYNPTDKIEPKFKIGDVLCDKSCTTLNKNSQPNIEVRDIRNDMYICNNCSFPISQQDEYELVEKRIEPQLAWSNEDEENLQDCIGAIWSANYYLYEDKQEMEAWLKRIKDRIGG